MGGFQLLPFYNGIRELGMVHHLIEDERSGAFAADAYARLSGRPGTCDATLGPGATNLVTALVESLNAGVPLVAVIGDAHRSHAMRNMTQEARQVDILRPAVKEILRIEDGSRIPELVRRAFSLATSGRPGPVVLVVPEDVAHGEFELDEGACHADPVSCAIPARRARPEAREVERAATLLAAARRPLILAGGGVHLSGAYDALLELSVRHGLPVAHTLSGKGSIPCIHPLSVGVFGRYSRIANDLILDSDCLLVVGCKLGEIATKRYALPLPSTPIVHLDVSAEEIGRWTRVDVGLWGDAACGLADLDDALTGLTPASRDEYHAEIAERKRSWAGETLARYASDAQPIEMPRLVGELRNAIPDDGVLVADGGFASHWAGLLYDTTRSGRTFIADRGFASIGYGLPGSIGAQLAHPEGPVVGLTGDGGLAMTVGGLEVARRIGAPLTLVVVNNAASGYVKALQHVVYGTGSYQSSDLGEVDFGAVARAFDCHGTRVTDPAELSSALADAIAHDGPAVVDVAVTRDPAEMLPGVDSRAAEPIEAGDRPA